MNKKDSKENSISPKEKEKLKQKLLRLMKEHEQKQKKRKTKGLDQNKSQEESIQQQQVNGINESRAKMKTKNKNKQKIDRISKKGMQISGESQREKITESSKKKLRKIHKNHTIVPEEAQRVEIRRVQAKETDNTHQRPEISNENPLTNGLQQANKKKKKSNPFQNTNSSKPSETDSSTLQETTRKVTPEVPSFDSKQKLKKDKKKKLHHIDENNTSNPREANDVPPSQKSAELETNHPASLPKKMNKTKKKKQKSISNPNEIGNASSTHEVSKDTANQHPLTNDQQKRSKNQKKKAKKRKVNAVEIDPPSSTSKKSKLAQKTEVSQKSIKNTKKAKKNKGKNQNLSSSVPDNDTSASYDANNMSGYVKGGDFDSDCDYAGDAYWQQQYANNFNGTEGSDDNSDDDYNYNAALEEHKIPGEDDDDSDESADDPYNYSDLEEDSFNDPYDYSDIDDEEEDEVHYSDFDEDDYEEDEDSYDYSDDSEFSSNFDEEEEEEEDGHDGEGAGKSYDFHDEEDDEDYKLPDDVPEDLIIHSGTATKRDIQPEDNVVFKDKKYCQIIELKNQETVKVVHQPSAYKKEELIKLTYKDNHVVKLITESHGIEEPKSNETESPKLSDTDSNDCPKLVPIIDEDGFQLYNPNATDEDDSEADEELDENCSYEYADDSSMDDVSLGSEYTEINSDDADSLMSEDINEKYMNRGQREYYSSDDEDIRKAAASLRTADVIDATSCAYSGPKRTKRKNNVMDPEDVNLLPSQKLSKLIKVGSKSTVLTTDILEKQLPEESTEKLTLNSDEEIKSSTDEIESKSKPSLEEKENKLESSKENKVELDLNRDEETNKNMQVSDNQSNIASHKQHNQQTPKKSTNQSLADYKTIFCNAINTNLVLVLLKDPFYIYGTVRLTLLAGKVDVYGHSLELNKEVEIFSPRGCSVIEISPLLLENEKTSGEQLQQLLKKYETDFLLADLENLTKSYEPGKDAVILLKRNEERKKVVHQFKKFMNENVFPNLQNINMDRPLYNSEYILRCMINTSATEQKCLRLPNQWLQLQITEKSRVLLAGGKGVGKSTLLRYLINKQLPKTQKVLLIDLDIGQPETFVPQTISCSLVTKPLLGPGFFLNIQPEKSYAVGHTNIALCSHRYVAAVRQLIDYCMSQQEFTNIPWFVNTMGYNKGFGLELISLICKALPLTDTIQLQSNKDINNFESLLFPHVVEKIPRVMFLENNSGAHDDTIKLTYRTHIWQSAISQESRYQKEWDMSPKDMRYAMLLTRLSMALAIKGHADFLTDCKPLCAPLDQLKLVNLTDDVPPGSPDELAKAMEANIVYLCHSDNNQNTVECLGIGVVRAIDYHVRQIYLVPAMDISLIKHVNCLALGEMPLPNSIFANQGSRVHKTAPFVYNTIEANASKAIKQIYHRPKAFLSGKHKSLD